MPGRDRGTNKPENTCGGFRNEKGDQGVIRRLDLYLGLEVQTHSPQIMHSLASKYYLHCPSFTPLARPVTTADKHQTTLKDNRIFLLTYPFILRCEL